MTRHPSPSPLRSIAALGTDPLSPLPQMAQLMSLVRDFKRREMVGLADFYAAKLGALEETLLVCPAGPPCPAEPLRGALAVQLHLIDVVAAGREGGHVCCSPEVPQRRVKAGDAGGDC